MPYVFVYTRVSTDLQRKYHPKKDDSLDVQRALCQKWLEMEQAVGRMAGYELAGPYEDGAVSAKMPLFKRPMGHLMFKHLKPGDVIISSSFDRMFRSTVDACLTDSVLKEMQVSFLVLDMPHLDTSTPTGRFVLSVMASMKEYDRSEIGRKTSEALRSRHERKLIYGSCKAIGWKFVYKEVNGKRTKTMVPDEAVRWQARILRWAMKLGCPRDWLYMHLNRKGVKRACGGNWGASVLYRYKLAAEFGFPNYSMTEYGFFNGIRPEFLPSGSRSGTRRNRKSPKTASSPDVAWYKALLSPPDSATPQPQVAAEYPSPILWEQGEARGSPCA